MQSLNDIINFYKECYLSDFKPISLVNFFGTNAEHQLLLKSFEPISKNLGFYPVDSGWGKTIDEALTLHSKEKTLYAAAFFLKGKTKVFGKQRNVFTPLYLYEVNLNFTNEVYSINIDTNNPILNPAFLEFLKTIDQSIETTYDELNEKMPSSALDFENLILFKKNLKSLFPSINIESIESLLASDFFEEDLRSIYKSRSKQYEMKLITGVALALIKKPKGTRGVINELATLSERKIGNNLIRKLFFNTEHNNIELKKRDINIPASLSESQKQVFYSLDANPITLVIGPPGTGKSFTIAGLATELISKGKSVLIASKNNQAGKVISDKIENDFGLKGLVIKTARKSYKRSLRTRLNNIIYGIKTKNIDRSKLGVQKNNLLKTIKEINLLMELLLKKEKEEIKWGKFFHNYEENFFSKFKAKWFEYKHNYSRTIWDIKKELNLKEKKKNRLSKKYIKDRYHLHLHTNLVKKRNQFVQLIDALHEDLGNLIHKKFEQIDFNLVLDALPAWICNTSDVHNILPLKEKIFDVLIIDEATQCDIASTIPLIYRAKKIIIVGDPKQLRHFSFLSIFQQNILKKKYNLNDNIPDYRKNSILDLVNKVIQNQDQVIFLDEHYRSKPDIIAFSNDKFYSNKLKILTSSPSTILTKNIFIKKVDGQRDSKGQNSVEAKNIILTIQQIIENEIHIDKKLCESIGIISPFTAQVTLIKSLVKSSINLNDLKRHNILIGTPYHFQGEERDVVLLSFVVDDETHPSTFTYLNKEDVFNVSITRARNKQIVFTSLNYKNLKPRYLLSQYLNKLGQQANIYQEENEIYDHFSEEVITIIKTWEVTKVLKSFPVAGVNIDIVVIKNNKSYCIDLIGYPGEFESQFTPAKIQMLDRMNQNVFFLPYSTWYLAKEKCVENLFNFIHTL